MQKGINKTSPPVQTILRVGERPFLGKNENRDKRFAFFCESARK
jgi:hypothetical protein